MQLDLTKYYQTISSIRQRCPYSGLPEEIRSAFEKELRLRLSWNTNSLEGNTLTLEETVDALEYDEVRSGHTYSEYTEAKTAYEANCELSFRKTQEINIDLIHPFADGNGRTAAGAAKTYEILEDICRKLQKSEQEA